MIAYSVFSHDPVMSTNSSYNYYQLPFDKYLQWKKEFTFHALQGQRYAQSFCNEFNISDNILFFDTDPERADAYIRKFYIAK